MQPAGVGFYSGVEWIDFFWKFHINLSMSIKSIVVKNEDDEGFTEMKE
jgi:hypothetical protein